MYCHKCGTQIAEGAAFCHKCGTKVVYVEPAEQSVDTPASASEPVAASSPTAVTPANPAPQAATATIQASAPINVSGNDGNDFKAFVDNHVRATTSFKSAEELLNSKPMTFAWIIFGVLSVFGIVLGSVNIGGFVGALEGLFVFGGFLGYCAFVIVGGVIRSKYRTKYSGKIDRTIDLEDFHAFLNTHLKSVSACFHECGYMTKSGGVLTTIEKTVSKVFNEVTLCCVFGNNRKNMATIIIRPSIADPGSGKMDYFAGAARRGFLVDGRASGFLSHACLIRTAPIMQAAMQYYVQTGFDWRRGAQPTVDSAATPPSDTGMIGLKTQYPSVAEPTIAENTQQPSNTSKTNVALLKAAKIGHILMWGSLALLLLLSFCNIPISPVIPAVGTAIGIILSAIGAERPLGLSKIMELVVAVVILVTAVVYPLLSGGASDKYVQMVKDGTLMAYPQMTVGEAFDGFLDKPKWESGLSDENERFVNVKGEMLYYEKEVELLVQFIIVDEEDGTFEYNACEINGVPQINLVFWQLLEAIYNDDSAYSGTTASKGLESQGESGLVSDITDKTIEGLCYKGIPMKQLLGKSKADIISIFGEPEPSELEDEFVYGDVNMYFDTWTLPEPFFMGIYGGPLNDYTYNGQPFSADKQKIIEIMGREPDFDGTSSISYYWDYLDSTVDLTFSFIADKYTIRYVDISISWWHPFGPVEGSGNDYYDGPGDDYYDMPDLPDGFEWVEGPLWDTDSGEIIGVIKNVSGKTKEYVSISFNLYDYNGYRIGSAGDFIFDLGDGYSWKFEANTSKDTAWYEFAELYGG